MPDEQAARVLRAGGLFYLCMGLFSRFCAWALRGADHTRPQFNDARDGLSFAICFTVACSSSALNEGNEQMRLLQANAAGSPRSGYSTSGLGNLPSRRSSHSSRL
jgi:hypothetical protein